MIELIHATKILGKKTIVDNLSFRVFSGEVFGLLGPNGAGKTTAIRLMVGLIRLTKGDIIVGGYSIQSEFQRAVAQIGAVVENPLFYNFLTGYENLLHYARMVSGIPISRIHEVAQVMDIEERLHDLVKIYSLGMRQRLGIAQALLHQPKVIILDEPTNGLDPMGIKELREYLRCLAKNEGVAVIVSSHLLSEMEMLCDRVAIIKNGRLLGVNTIGETPTEYVVEFFVETPEKAEILIRAAFPSIILQKEQTSVKMELKWEGIPEIVNTLVHGGVKIYEIQPQQRRLEELFMEVTRD